MKEQPTIFLSAAEASGDEHAARLIRALRRRLPGARFVGAAGPRMAEEGCQALADMTARASMLGGPLLQLSYYWRTLRLLKRAIREMRPDVFVPVDSPALNWHLAKAARQSGVAVGYYIAPQVWAWAPWRVKKLARLTDRVACILPFEQDYLRKRGVNATFVGHPLFDDLPPPGQPLPDLAEAHRAKCWRVALLPGSRQGEIAAHAPALGQVAQAIRSRWPDARYTFTARTEACADAIRRACGSDAQIAVGRTRQVLAESHFAVAASGTVTLEVANFGVPAVVFYRASRFLYNLVGRWMIRTPHLCLVNILAGRQVVPELMPWYGSAERLTRAAMKMMEDLPRLLTTRADLLKIAQPLRVPPPGSASDNAAEVIAGLLD